MPDEGGRLQVGYSLMCEEHAPAALLQQAEWTERHGLAFALISDHFHPWTRAQGQSPFAWSVLGAIAERTRRIAVGTAVTCPTMRYHPAVVAQAAATVACMMPGRFFLGLGTGENLNEHILGARWPRVAERRAMLEEAIEVIRRLWEGRPVNHRGPHVTVEDARIFTLPEELPPIVVAAGGRRTAELAARNDGMMAVAPQAELVEAFEQAGGRGKPRYGQIHVCWAPTEEEARRTAYAWWPNGAMQGGYLADVRRPEDFEDLALMLSEDDLAQAVVCGPDPERHAAALRAFAGPGFTHVAVHQVGEVREEFFTFYEREVLPRLGS